jgi:hypothetical protein
MHGDARAAGAQGGGDDRRREAQSERDAHETHVAGEPRRITEPQAGSEPQAATPLHPSSRDRATLLIGVEARIEATIDRRALSDAVPTDEGPAGEPER